jgi:ribosomal protein L7/L12
MKNYHQELLKIMPNITGKNMQADILHHIVVHAPKSIIDAYATIVASDAVVGSSGGDATEDTRVHQLIDVVRLGTTQRLSLDQAKDIIASVDGDRKMEAMRKVREAVDIYLGVKDAKAIIDTIPVKN